MATFDPNSRVIDYYENTRDNKRLTIISGMVPNKNRSSDKKSAKILIRINLKKKHLNLEANEGVELRFMQLQRGGMKATQSQKYANLIGFNCKIFINSKLLVQFPLEKGAESTYSRKKPLDVTDLMNGKTLTQEIEIHYNPSELGKTTFLMAACKVQKFSNVKVVLTRRNLLLEQLIHRTVDTRETYQRVSTPNLRTIFKQELGESVKNLISKANLKEKWTAVRGAECEHLQCFQLEEYLLNNLNNESRLEHFKSKNMAYFN
jgi:hypothetical protein